MDGKVVFEKKMSKMMEILWRKRPRFSISNQKVSLTNILSTRSKKLLQKEKVALQNMAKEKVKKYEKMVIDFKHFHDAITKKMPEQEKEEEVFVEKKEEFVTFEDEVEEIISEVVEYLD